MVKPSKPSPYPFPLDPPGSGGYGVLDEFVWPDVPDG